MGSPFYREWPAKSVNRLFENMCLAVHIVSSSPCMHNCSQPHTGDWRARSQRSPLGTRHGLAPLLPYERSADWPSTTKRRTKRVRGYFASSSSRHSAERVLSDSVKRFAGFGPWSGGHCMPSLLNIRACSISHFGMVLEVAALVFPIVLMMGAG